MIELIQFPWSPFCIVTRRILEFSGVRFKIRNIPNGERSLVWKLTKGGSYGVPLIVDGREPIFELSDDTQVIAKYIDDKYSLGLFPREMEGVQSILWRYLENDIEGIAFKLNDIYWKEFVPADDHLRFLRHKERKFGRGCIDQWRAMKPQLFQQLEEKLVPFEEMLAYKPYLLDQRPRFVDFNLYGMLGNLLFTKHYALPKAHNHIRAWHRRMEKLTLAQVAKNK